MDLTHTEEFHLAVRREAERQREAMQNDPQGYLEQLHQENEAIRQRKAAAAAAEGKALAAQREAEVEAELEPVKLAEQRRWLAEHPDKTAADFLAHAWPQLRGNVIEERASTRLQRQTDILRRQYGGRY